MHARDGYARMLCTPVTGVLESSLTLTQALTGLEPEGAVPSSLRSRPKAPSPVHCPAHADHLTLKQKPPPNSIAAPTPEPGTCPPARRAGTRPRFTGCRARFNGPGFHVGWAPGLSSCSHRCWPRDQTPGPAWGLLLPVCLPLPTAGINLLLLAAWE